MAALLLGAEQAIAQRVPQVVSGVDHTVALRADGTVFAWGNNLNGQLGDGQVLHSFSPLPVTALTGARAIAAGDYHAIAIDAQGRVVAWGSNERGQLGDGSLNDRPAPREVPGLPGAASICAAREFSMASTEDGRVWAWGGGGYALFGTGDFSSSDVPREVQGISQVSAIACSDGMFVAIRRDGSVWAWGLPLGRDSPQPMEGISEAASVAVDETAFVVKRDGTVWGWGSNSFGQLLSPDTSFRRTAAQLPGLAGVTRVGTSGSRSNFAVRDDGSLVSWGGSGGLGWPGSGAQPRPLQPVPGISDAIDVAVAGHVLVLHRSQRVSAWGDNVSGALGIGIEEDERGVPSPIPGIENATGIWAAGSSALGRGISFARLGDGQVRAWGSNEGARLTVAREPRSSIPVQVRGLDNIVQVAAGGGYSLAVRSDGTALAWGLNFEGQLGNGTYIDRSTPTRVSLPAGVVALSSGEGQSIALLSDGTVWSWGPFGFYAGPMPEPVPDLADIVSVAAGDEHALALKRDGTVWSFGGFNFFGELGNDSDGSPARVQGLNEVVGIAAGGKSSFAVRRDGTLWGWGGNEFGQLGDGATQDRDRPVKALVEGVAQVSSSHRFIYGHTLAVRTDGTLWSWGSGQWGELAQGRMEDVPRPRPVAQLSDVAGAATGYGYSLVWMRGGGVAGWGANATGALADGTFAHRTAGAAAKSLGGRSVFDLTPDDPPGLPASLAPVVDLVTSSKSRSQDALEVETRVFFAPEDVGRTGSVYVFALAPADQVLNASSQESFALTKAKHDGKDAPVECVLAQLTASGQLVAVSASSMQAYATGVLTGAGQSVNIVNGVPAASIGGSTFYVGYGSSAAQMLSNGTNRSAVTVPAPTECRPQPPQTGWWWQPPAAPGQRAPRDGTGYSIEAQGPLLFFAAFLYDQSGRASWYVASGRTSVDGALFTGDLLQARGGQTLGGPYRPFSSTSVAGPITLAFDSATTGTLSWPGGTFPIGRFDIVPNGLAAPPRANEPESGWWWNPQESGRGFFIEWQDGTADLAGYMYDDSGNPVWYIAVVPTADPMRLSASWLQFGDGMTLTGAWRPHQLVNNSVAPVTIEFTSATTGIMTLPNGRTTSLQRHRF